MIERFCEVTLRDIRTDQMEIASVITSGQCRTFEHYREMVGQLKGLQKAEMRVQSSYNALVETKYLHQGADDESKTKSEFY